MSVGRLGIVADDLTGALDSSAPFAVCGRSVYLPLSTSGRSGCDVAAVTTESRTLAPEAAADAVRQAVLSLASDGRWIYKKIDSLLRGNVGAEVAAAAKACGADVVLVAPAFPEQGRTVVGGRVYVHGRELTDALRDADPLAVGAVGSVQAALAELGEAVAIPLTEVRRGADAVAKHLDRLNGGTAVADAEIGEDMAILARATMLCRKRVMPCGSAGLACALAHEPAKGGSTGTSSPASLGRALGPVLVVAGSQSKVTSEQVAHLRQRAGTTVVEVRGVELGGPLARSAGRGLAGVLGKGKTAVLVLTCVRELLGEARSAGRVAEVTEYAAGCLGEIAAEAAGQVRLGGLLLTGGATAMGVLKALGCEGLEVLGEAASGIPVSRAVGGLADKALVVTKAGSFGHPSLMCDIVDVLGGADG